MKTAQNAARDGHYGGTRRDPEHDGSAAKTRPAVRPRCRLRSSGSARQSVGVHGQFAAIPSVRLAHRCPVGGLRPGRLGWQAPVRSGALFVEHVPPWQRESARAQPPDRSALPMVLAQPSPAGRFPSTTAKRPAEHPPIPTVMQPHREYQCDRIPIPQASGPMVQARRYRSC